MARVRKPLWTCPKCGHRFVTRNLWHSCGRYRLADHFTGKPSFIRSLFDQWRQLAESCGPITVYAQKSRIVFQVRVRFAGAVTHSRWLDAGLWLMRQAGHPSLHRVESFGPLGFGHHFRLTKPSDVDSDLAELMREAYAVGCQKHLEDRDRKQRLARVTRRRNGGGLLNQELVTVGGPNGVESSGRRVAATKALWKCPHCGRGFAKRNQSHSCQARSLDEHFRGRPPRLRQTFDTLLKQLKTLGPFRVDAVKSSINLAHRFHFGGVKITRDGLRLGFLTADPVKSPRICKVEPLGPRRVAQFVDLEAPGDVDDQLMGWLGEAYRLKR